MYNRKTNARLVALSNAAGLVFESFLNLAYQSFQAANQSTFSVGRGITEPISIRLAVTNPGSGCLQVTLHFTRGSGVHLESPSAPTGSIKLLLLASNEVIFGLFPKWMHAINPLNFGNVPSGGQEYSLLSLASLRAEKHEQVFELRSTVDVSSLIKVRITEC